MAKGKSEELKKDRGKEYVVNLNTPITFNGEIIKKAVIELDHINFGIESKTGNLKKKRRLNFTLNDIKQFIAKLDGEDLIAEKYQGNWSLFVARVDSPIKGKFKDKEFIMVFKINYKKNEVIHTVTLYPGW